MITLNPHPKAKAAWDAAAEQYRADFPEAESAFGHVCDLAREAFYARVAGKEDDPRFPREAPIVARAIALDWTIKWVKP